MKDHDLVRRLILRAPPDLVDAVYEQVRRHKEVSGKVPCWPRIARAAQGLGIFTTDEARAFLKMLLGRGVDGEERQG